MPGMFCRSLHAGLLAPGALSTAAMSMGLLRLRGPACSTIPAGKRGLVSVSTSTRRCTMHTH